MKLRFDFKQTLQPTIIGRKWVEMRVTVVSAGAAKSWYKAIKRDHP